MEECREYIISEEYMDFLIPAYRYTDDIEIKERAGCVQNLGFNYRSAHVNAGKAGEITIDRFGYNSIPKCYTLLDMSALNVSGITAVQNYPTLSLRGEGVMIGIVDTGIQYNNPVFCNSRGETRIAGIWDQTIQSGTPPEGIFYGSEYTEEMINMALRTEQPLETVPTVDDLGHGTFVASVAAGGADAEKEFSGAAPEAILGIVKLKEAKQYLKDFYMINGRGPCYQENDIMQGIRYLHELALKKNLPLVIAFALGTNLGAHNGTSLLSKYLDEYANTLNRCIVIGGGNEANKRHHYLGKIRRGEKAHEAELRAERGNTGFTAELWCTLPDIVTAYLVSPSGERSPALSIRQAEKYTLNFVFDGVRVDVEYRLLPENSDSHLIFFRFQGKTEGIWKIGVEPSYIIEGEYHIWLPVEEFLDSDVYFLEANPDTTLTEPGSTKDSITISYYNSNDNSIDINSGRGYTRSMVRKPDFAAPGVDITGLWNAGRYTQRSGSSASVGITAGAAALIMEWLIKQPMVQGITCSQIRNVILFGVRQREDMEFPNREWGYGTMDVYQSLNRLREL